MANEAIHAQMVGKGGNQDSYPSACGSRFRPCPYCLLALLHDIFPPAAIPQHAIPDRSCGECITDDRLSVRRATPKTCLSSATHLIRTLRHAAHTH